MLIVSLVLAFIEKRDAKSKNRTPAFNLLQSLLIGGFFFLLLIAYQAIVTFIL